VLQQAFEAQMRGKKRAEERAARQAEKVAKEETKRQEELRTYKSLMKVGGYGFGGDLLIDLLPVEPLHTSLSFFCMFRAVPRNTVPKSFTRSLQV
jgi:hypothetical protein